LVLTKDVLCQLSYIGLRSLRELRPTSRPLWLAFTPRRRGDALPTTGFGLPTAAPTLARSLERRVERETGIEPATNSLEGWDSTPEVLPPSRRPRRPRRYAGHARLPCTDNPSLPGFSTGPSTRSTRSGHSTRPSARPAMSE